MTHIADWTISIIIALAIAAGVLIICMWRTHMQLRRHQYHAVHASSDLQRIVERDAERPAWMFGVLVAVMLIAIISWTSQRDERDNLVDRRDPRLSQALATLRCPDPERGAVIMSIGMQADGKTPKVSCVVVDSLLGNVYEIHRIDSTPVIR